MPNIIPVSDTGAFPRRAGRSAGTVTRACCRLKETHGIDGKASVVVALNIKRNELSCHISLDTVLSCVQGTSRG